MRGKSEETLLQKRDDFWRRFSIVAKEPVVKDERCVVSLALFLSDHSTMLQFLAQKDPERLKSYERLGLFTRHFYLARTFCFFLLELVFMLLCSALVVP